MATMTTPPLQTGPRPPYKIPLAGRLWLSGLALAGACSDLLWAQILTIGGASYSFSSAHAACTSGIGQLAQALSAPAATDCTAVGDTWLALVLGIIAGAVLALRGLFLYLACGRTQR